MCSSVTECVLNMQSLKSQHLGFAGFFCFVYFFVLSLLYSHASLRLSPNLLSQSLECWDYRPVQSAQFLKTFQNIAC